MEARRLLSFASLNAHGILSVAGTAKNDAITIQFAGANVQAILNGQTLSFNKSDVRRIWADGFGGNDALTNKTSLPSTLIGSSGNDTLVGGSGDDSLDGGSGVDSVDYSSRTGAWVFNTPVYVSEETETDGSAQLGDETDQIDPSVEVYVGSKGNDSFHANLGATESASGLSGKPFTLYGGAGDDYFDLGNGGFFVCYGGDGNDSFDISDGGGFESCYGGAGNDILSPFIEAGLPFFDGGSGTDTVDVGESEQRIISIQNSPSVEDVVGAGGQQPNQEIIGNDLNNYISGNDDDEQGGVTLLGGGGNDTLIGSRRWF